MEIQEKEKWCGHEFLYRFNKFWFMEPYLITTQKVVQNFKPLPTDVILASFPKTGTTWLKAILHSIIHRSSKPADQSPLLFNHPQQLIPSLETNLYVHDKTPEFDHTDTPRILATHIPYQIISDILTSSDCKIVYVTRNPKDTLISLWHFVQKSKTVVEEDPWDLETAVDQFCKGVVPFGSYYDHVLAYRDESINNPHKVFFVTYEDLKKNPENHLKQMAQFLGFPFEGDEEEIHRVVEDCSFEILSNREVNKSSEIPDGFPLPFNSFFRKGEVGDYVNYLEAQMIDKIDVITRKKFHDNGFAYGI